MYGGNAGSLGNRRFVRDLRLPGCRRDMLTHMVPSRIIWDWISPRVARAILALGSISGSLGSGHSTRGGFPWFIHRAIAARDTVVGLILILRRMWCILSLGEDFGATHRHLRRCLAMRFHSPP